jgi:hypothetical protein
MNPLIIFLKFLSGGFKGLFSSSLSRINNVELHTLICSFNFDMPLAHFFRVLLSSLNLEATLEALS